MTASSSPSERRPARRRAALAPLVVLLFGLTAAAAARAQQPLSALPVDVDEVTRGAKSSVVTLVAQRTTTARVRRGGETVARTLTRVGSGVAVEPDIILTSASIVTDAAHIRVRASNGLESDAKVIALDAVFNLALLQVDQLRLPPLPMAQGRIVQVGDWVITLATSYRSQSTQSVGYVSYRYNEPRSALLQTTNTVYPGNSGGAALNALGELIGIIQGELGPPETAPAAEGERRPSGNSFILPVDVVLRIYPQLRRLGRVPHGYFGASTSAAHVESESRPGLRVPIGARVEHVFPGSPAERMGLLPGDLIVGFDLERVEYPAQLARWVSMSRPGTGVRITWVRDDLQHVGEARLGESPYAAPQWALAADTTPRRAGESPGDSLDRRSRALRGAAARP